jgi:hypothetical protein
MIQCQSCGAENPADYTFCGDCGRQRRSSQPLGISTPYGSQLRLASGEVIKRAIPVTSRRGPAGGGAAQLFVTDARIIYVAQTKNWLNQYLRIEDIQLQDVNGVNIELRRGLGIFGASMLVILTLYAAAALLLLHSPQVFLFTAVPAVIIAVVGLRRAGVFLTISARQSGSSTMVIGVANDIGRTSGLIFLLKLWLTWPVAWIFPLLGVMDAIDVVNNRPTREAVTLFQELGALVLELQRTGVLSDAEGTSATRTVQP